MKIAYLLLVLVVVSSCSTTFVMKECKPVVDNEKWICKNLKPWE